MGRHLPLGFLATAALAFAAVAGEPFIWPIPAWMPPPPVPADNPMTPEKVELGRHLFYDARLSADRSVACVSCHVPAKAFSDGRTRSIGINGTPGIRNSPSLSNAAYFPQLTWANPHIDSLEFQSLIPLFGDNPEEMGSNGREQEIFERLAADPYYADAFPRAFPERPVIDLFTVTRALATFQRTLISVGSPYDRFKYHGERHALPAAAQRGEQLFFDHRFECYHCHTGIHLTNNLQTAFSPFAERGAHNTGLYNLDGQGAYPAEATGFHEFTGEAADMGKFRTPSLRNVAITAPYFHDGSAATLHDVLAHYAAGGRTIPEGPRAGVGSANPHKDGMLMGFEATPEEIEDLLAFLRSLTDADFIANPAHADPWPPGHPASVTRTMP